MSEHSRTGDTRILVLGRDHEEPDQVHAWPLLGGRAALALSPGLSGKPNEDALGVFERGGDLVLALADGHWGREASELAVERALWLLEPHGMPEVGVLEERFARLCEGLNETLGGPLHPPDDPGSETTLLVCCLGRPDPRRVGWASFGDSFLFAWDARGLRRLNTSTRSWLGARSRDADLGSPPAAGFRGAREGIETGLHHLEPGATLLLASDGLVEPGDPRSPLPDSRIAEVLGDGTPALAQVRSLVNLALAAGGLDNIAVILYRAD